VARLRTKRKRRSTSRTTPKVFAVHRSETADGRFHEVAWAKDGNLNAAYSRGNIKRFRLWPKAKSFAKSKGEALGVEPTID
jgi:hypothetical protein